MGGRAPVCPFCKKLCNDGGVKDHIKAKHPDKYQQWIKDECPPYFLYNDKGELNVKTR